MWKVQNQKKNDDFAQPSLFLDKLHVSTAQAPHGANFMVCLVPSVWLSQITKPRTHIASRGIHLLPPSPQKCTKTSNPHQYERNVPHILFALGFLHSILLQTTQILSSFEDERVKWGTTRRNNKLLFRVIPFKNLQNPTCSSSFNPTLIITCFYSTLIISKSSIRDHLVMNNTNKCLWAILIKASRFFIYRSKPPNPCPHLTHCDIKTLLTQHYSILHLQINKTYPWKWRQQTEKKICTQPQQKKTWWQKKIAPTI